MKILQNHNNYKQLLVKYVFKNKKKTHLKIYILSSWKILMKVMFFNIVIVISMFFVISEQKYQKYAAYEIFDIFDKLWFIVMESGWFISYIRRFGKCRNLALELMLLLIVIKFTGTGTKPDPLKNKKFDFDTFSFSYIILTAYCFNII